MSTPQPPDNEDCSLLSKWLPPEEELDEAMSAFMMAAGYSRNIMRHAQAWGPALICALVKCGALEPEGDPLEALESLICRDDL